MGIFRDLFNKYFGEFIRDRLDGIKNIIEQKVGAPVTGIKDFFTGKLGGVIEGALGGVRDKLEMIAGIKAQLETMVGKPLGEIKGFLDTKIGTPIKTALDAVTGKVVEVVTEIKGLTGKVGEFITPVGDLVLGVKDMGVNKLREVMIWRMKDAADVKSLNAAWKSTPPPWNNDEVVKAFYLSEKEKLEDQGLNTPTDVVLGWVGKQIAAGIWAIEEKALPKILEWIEEFGDKYHIQRKELDAMKSLARSGEFGLNAVVSFVLGVTLYPAAMSAAEPAWMKIRQESYKVLPIQLLDPGMLVRLKYRELIAEAYYMDQFRRLGFSDENISLAEKDFLFYPAPQDFIRFAVRETFRPDIVSKYGYDKDFPSTIVPHAAKAGLSEEWLRHYWYAHWEIPGPTLGFEMLHRGLITIDDLRTLLKTADYAPGWIEPVINAAYTPITRVDLRRLYQDGVIDRTRLKKGYKDIGYNEENAEYITEWTIIDMLAPEKELTRTMIETLYKEGQIRREDAMTHIMTLGYDYNKADYILALVDIKIQDADEKDLIAAWTDQFKLHTIDINTFESNLNLLHVTEARKKSLIAKAKLTEAGFITIPAVGDLKKWLKLGIITSEQFKKKMMGLGYSAEDIGLYEKEVALST